MKFKIGDYLEVTKPKQNFFKVDSVILNHAGPTMHLYMGKNLKGETVSSYETELQPATEAQYTEWKKGKNAK